MLRNDAEMVNNALANLAEGGLRRRQLQQQHEQEMLRIQMEEELRKQQLQDMATYRSGLLNERNNALDWRTNPNNPQNALRSAQTDQITDPNSTKNTLSAARAEHLGALTDQIENPKQNFYIVHAKTGNFAFIHGTQDEANAKMQQMAQLKPEEAGDLEIATKQPPVTNKVPTVQPDGMVLFVDSDTAAKINSQKEIADKQAAAKAEGTTKTEENVTPVFNKDAFGNLSPALETNKLTGAVSPLMKTNRITTVTKPNVGYPQPPAPAPKPSTSLPTINTQEDYDALPVGAKYVDSSGQVATKRGQSKTVPSDFNITLPGR